VHLAELNISRWKIDPESDIAKGFVNNVGRVNSLARRSEGFVWRLEDEARDENGRNPVCPDDKTEMTLSVWETPEHLEHFVWNTAHKKIYRKKHDWFAVLESHHLVMWWIAEGHRPTLEEAKERLDYLDKHGNTDYAFDWAHLPQTKLWQSDRIA